MSRMQPLDRADANEKVGSLLDRIQPLGIMRMVAHAQRAFPHWLRWGGVLLDAEQFDAQLRELAILRVASLTPGADYEWVQHEAIHGLVGGTPQQAQAIQAGDLESDVFSDDGKLVLRFTTQVVQDASPDDATYAAMAQRFSEAEIIQLLLVIGQYMMLGRIMATTQIDLDPALNVLEAPR